MTRKPSVRLDLPQGAAAYTLLKANCAHVDGFAVYAEGFSDEVIAQEVGGGATAEHIARIRLKHFGKLAPVGTGDEARKLAETVKAMGHALDSLTARVEALEEKGKPRAVA